jgi:hypothetical protein
MLEATKSKHHRSSFSAALIALKPRQVLLAEQLVVMEKKPLTSDQSTLLLHSVLRYLQNGGFSKTLKRFLSEAQIQNDNWKTSSLDLEDLLFEYSDKCKAAINLNVYKKEDIGNDDNSKIDGNIKTVAEETIKKIKKRKRDVRAIEEKEILEVNAEPKEEEEKKKKKKKDKPIDDSSSAVVENTLADKKATSKDKTGKMELDQEIPVKNNSVKESLDEAVKSDKKSSRRKKRLLGVDNKMESLKDEAIEEPKQRKTEAIEEEIVAKVEEDQLNNHENGKLDNNGEVKSAKKKSAKKQENNVSSETKTVNAFQRVKIDEVEFADEKLQDNSYWAKSGAEVGYGAKAQEILGQVRGRDFRHEKTKKKRGSYRGGQIDLDSHSIKFNYSDED